MKFEIRVIKCGSGNIHFTAWNDIVVPNIGEAMYLPIVTKEFCFRIVDKVLKIVDGEEAILYVFCDLEPFAGV